jgi:hypothetical protein
MNQEFRVGSEWVALRAFRELLKIATKGDMAKSTDDEALEFGGELYLDLLGRESQDSDVLLILNAAIAVFKFSKLFQCHCPPG